MGELGRVLIVCAQCDGEDVGEAWCGYEWVSRIARQFDVTVLTLRFPGHKPPSEQLPGVHVVEWDGKPYVSSRPRFNSAIKPWYPLFYMQSRAWIKDAIGRGERFALLHHLTPMAMRYPSPCAALGVPYVIGPIAGSVDTPPGMAGELDTQPMFMRLRGIDKLRLAYDPLMRRTYEDARTVICSAPYAAETIGRLRTQDIEIETEVGIEGMAALAPRPRNPGQLRMVHVGRIVRTKGLRDAIRAMGRLQDRPGVTLDVAGEGEDLDACRREAQELGVGSRVNFLGRLKREEVEALYARSDVLLFPSFREATGIVLFEAMGRGLPVITANTGGPGFIVDDSCGVRVAPDTPDQFAIDLAAAIRRLSDDPLLSARMGVAAHARCLELAQWERKLARLAQIYGRVAAQKVVAPQTAGSLEGLAGVGRQTVDVAS